MKQQISSKRVLLSVITLVIMLLGTIWVALARPALIFTTNNNPENISASTKLLENHVRILSEKYIPRDYNNKKNLDSTAQHIFTTLSDYGLHTRYQVFKTGKSTYKNVIATIGDSSKEIIVIGAHYDAMGEHPGADDNASGVAGLLELGRLLQSQKLDKQVHLVAYTLEEPPFFGTIHMGSHIHAAAERKKGRGISLMISLEMIGYFSDKPHSQEYPSPFLKLFYPSKGNFITVVDNFYSSWGRKAKIIMSEHSSLPVYSINASPSVIQGIDYSDHRNYWAHDYDAIMITNTSFYRNNHYHTEDDTADKLNYDRMGEVIKGVYYFVKSIQND